MDVLLSFSVGVVNMNFSDGRIIVLICNVVVRKSSFLMFNLRCESELYVRTSFVLFNGLSKWMPALVFCRFGCLLFTACRLFFLSQSYLLPPLLIFFLSIPSSFAYLLIQFSLSCDNRPLI